MIARSKTRFLVLLITGLATFSVASAFAANQVSKKSVGLPAQVKRCDKKFSGKSQRQRKARKRCIARAKESSEGGSHKGDGSPTGSPGSVPPPAQTPSPTPTPSPGPSPPPAPTVPDTAIDSAPAGPIAQRDVSVSFHSNPSGASFQCSLNGAAWSSCSSPAHYSSLADGPYEFAVRAGGGEGFDQTPATASFKVEVTPPQTTITSAPSGRIPTGAVSIEFSSDESGSTFECSLDGAAFSSCASPYELSSPVPGPHDLKVRAVNGAMVVDPSPPSAKWSSVEPRHDLCGSISHDTTIGPDYASVYTLDNCTLNVPSGVTLTVAPGTVVKSSGGATCATYECSISVEGTLDAIGTASEPVTFTSINDDSVGGDTSREEEEPKAGDWRGIAAVDPGATLDIEHATIAYALLAVQTINSGAVTLNDDQINEADSGVSSPNSGAGAPITVANNSIDGGIDLNCPLSLTVTGNTITGEPTVDGRGIEDFCNAAGSAVESVVDIANNHVTIPTDDGGSPAISVAAANLNFAALASNTIVAPSASDAIAVDGEVNASQAMPATPFPWEITGGDVAVDVPSGVTLTVAPGTVVKSSGGATCATYECSISVEGTLDAIGTASEPVTFTSINDDSVGGDTSREEEEPKAGDWRGIAAVDPGATLDIEHATIAYALLAVQTINSGAVTLNDDQINEADSGVSSPNSGAGAPITVANNSIDGGIDLNCPLSLTVTGNTITGEPTVDGRGIEDFCNAAGSAVESVVDIANNHVTIPTDDGGSPAISVAAANLNFAALASNTIVAPSASDAIAVDGEVNASQAMPATPFPWEITGGDVAVDVPSGVTLTVAPGTVVKSSGGATCATYECSISVEGTLDAIGTASEPVTFTSINDDSVGGDTSREEEEPKAGDWRGIAAVDPGATLDIEHATIAYALLAVQTINSGAVTLNDDQINEADSGVSSPNSGAGAPITVANNSIDGGIDLNCPLSLTVTGNTITGEPTVDGRGIEDFCNAAGSAVESVVDIANNHVTIPTDDGGSPAISVAAANLNFAALASNTIVAPSASDAIAVDGEVNASQAMPATPFPWEITGGDVAVDVPSGVTLTVAPGTVVKSSGGATCATYECSISVEGTLDAIGTASEPVTFTSINDDSVGGTTGSGEPEAGDWAGIYFADVENVELNRLDIRYATAAIDFGLLDTATISDSDFVYNDAAIAVGGTADDDPALGALACVPPYLSFVTVSNDWFGKYGYPAPDIDISSVIGAILPDEYSSLFGAASSFTKVSTSFGGDNTVPFSIYSCPELLIPPIPVTPVILTGTPMAPLYPDPEAE